MLEFFQRNVWLLLALLRVSFSLFPQTGYIHPDEFFQTVEVAAGTSSILLGRLSSCLGALKFLFIIIIIIIIIIVIIIIIIIAIINIIIIIIITYYLL